MGEAFAWNFGNEWSTSLVQIYSPIGDKTISMYDTDSSCLTLAYKEKNIVIKGELNPKNKMA